MIHFWHEIFLWFAIHTGTYNESGPYYGFFSGFGSDIGEITLIGALLVGYRKINCHVNGCRRIGHYPLEGTPYKLCRRHHPGIPNKVTHADILRLHKKQK